MSNVVEPALAGFDELFVEFGQILRESGMVVGSDDVITFCSAVAELDPTDIMDIYWSGRATLVRKKENVPVYNARFREFFLLLSEEVIYQ